jgi:hypothetical protein
MTWFQHSPQKWIAICALGLALSALLGCNGSSSGSTDASGLTAKVDGKDWTATEVSVSSAVVPGVPGAFLFTGTQISGGKTISITVTLFNVRGTGTYSLGVAVSADGGTGQVGEGTGSGGDAQSWITEGTGMDGQVVLTTLENNRIAGTFEYVAIPGSKNTTGVNRTVTEGKFDMPIKGSLVPVPDSIGGKLTATLNGKPYQAAVISVYGKDYLGGPGLSISTTTAKHGLSLMLANVTGPGTYALDNQTPARNITAGRNGMAETCCWGATGVPDSGSVTLTTLTSTRAKGTFTAVLKPKPGKSDQDLIVTDGVFDVGITYK